MATSRHKQISTKTLSRQLSRSMPDPKGDRLRSKIASCGVEEQATWQQMTPEMLNWCNQYLNPPRIGEHVIKIASYNAKQVILVFHEPLSGEPTLFMLVPNPMESL